MRKVWGRYALPALLALLPCALLLLGASSASAAFPGTPGLIALQRSADPNASQIWVLDWQTGAARQLTHRGYNADPAFSPNGRWLVFRSDVSRYGQLNIWAIRADGSGLRRLTKGRRELMPDNPVFSADGRWVAFSTDGPGGRRQVERVPFSGGRPQVLVPERGGTAAFSPTYSPNGRQLAWVEWGEARRAIPHIFIGRLDGSEGRRITTGLEPEFSPDGRSIVFVIQGRCSNGEVGSEIEVTSLEPRMLWPMKTACGVQLGAPTYSPDGSWISYSLYYGDRSEIGFMPAPEAVPLFTPLAGLGTDLPIDETTSWQPLGP